MRVVAVREIRSGDSILIEGRDKPYIVASVQRFRGLTSITACDPDSTEIGACGEEYPTECVTFVLDDSDRAAVLV
jgi:hypothetical protein